MLCLCIVGRSKYFTQVKVIIPQSRNTVLKVKDGSFTILLKWKYKSISINILKVKLTVLSGDNLN